MAGKISQDTAPEKTAAKPTAVPKLKYIYDAAGSPVPPFMPAWAVALLAVLPACAFQGSLYVKEHWPVADMVNVEVPSMDEVSSFVWAGSKGPALMWCASVVTVTVLAVLCILTAALVSDHHRRLQTYRHAALMAYTVEVPKDKSDSTAAPAALQKERALATMHVVAQYSGLQRLCACVRPALWLTLAVLVSGLSNYDIAAVLGDVVTREGGIAGQLRGNPQRRASFLIAMAGIFETLAWCIPRWRRSRVPMLPSISAMLEARQPSPSPAGRGTLIIPPAVARRWKSVDTDLAWQLQMGAYSTAVPAVLAWMWVILPGIAAAVDPATRWVLGSMMGNEMGF